MEDKKLLQREQKGDVAAALPLIAYGAVLAIALTLIALLGWALRRVALTSGERVKEKGPAPTRRERVRTSS